MPIEARITALLTVMANMTTPEEEFKNAGYTDVEEFISDLGDDRLCDEYSAFMELIREAKAIVKELS